MTLSQGARFGAFEIVAPLGKGGMGEVYRARDVRLGREVALKVLPREVAREPESLLRLEREAKALAALRHPNVATLHGFEREGDTSFLIMELIEGETLAESIARGPLPWRRAVPIFEAIAEGLKAAHERDIVHRDLKPANIKIDEEGRPKILDFGLAQSGRTGAAAGSGTGSGADLSQTLTVQATMPGTLLGTAAYMAPEQARGERVDRRADVWAFGCCLYEALAGARAFAADNVPLTLAAVLTQEPDFKRLPADLPRELESLLRRCLEKDPRRRLQDLGDARWWLAEGLGAADRPAPSAPRTPRRAALAAAAAAGLALGATIASLVTGGSSQPAGSSADDRLAVLRFVTTAPLPLPSMLQGRQFAVDPRGRALVFAAAGGGLHLHDFEDGTTRPIAGTDSGEQPFFSSDGDWIGFLREEALYKVPVRGGLSQRVCTLPPGIIAGLDWSGDRIVFAMFSGPPRGLWTVSAAGGEPERLGEDPDLRDGLTPSFLGDRPAILYSSSPVNVTPETTQRVHLLDLDTGEVRDLGIDGRAPRYLESGHLIWARGEDLWAAAFDPERRQVVGEGRPVMPLLAPNLGSAPFTASANGTLVTVEPDRVDLLELSFDGSRRALAEHPVQVRHPRYSRDGRHVAYTRGNVGAAQIWIHEVATGRESRFSEDPNQVFPVWTRDGRIVYFDVAEKNFLLRAGDPEHRSDPVSLCESDEAVVPFSVSADGIVLFGKSDSLWRVDLAKPGSAEPWLEEAAGSATFSPDDRWVAYDANLTGERQVYVRPYPGPGAARPVSIDGGLQPAWSPDGRMLYFISRRGLEAIDVEAEGAALVLGESRFVLPLEPDRSRLPTVSRSYDLRPDGRALVAAQRRDQPARFSVFVNLGSELGERLGIAGVGAR